MTQATKNFLSRALIASIVQWLTLAAPLITMPILIKSLGLSGYGQLAICAAIAGYLNIWIDFGFRWSATRALVLARDQESKNRIFWEVQFTKLLLAVIGVSLIIAISAITIQNTQLLKLVSIATVLSAIGNLLYPTWMLEGSNKTIASSVYIFFGRAIQALSVVFFVKSNNDIYIAVIAECSVAIISGGFCLQMFFLTPIPTNNYFKSVFMQVKSSIPFFLTNISTSLYSVANPIILGIICNSSSVGVYTAADKIIQAAKRLIHPLCAISFPRWITLTSEKSRDIKKETIIVSSIYLIWGLTAWITMYFFTDSITKLLVGKQFSETNSLIQIMSPIPFLAMISHIAGYHFLIPQKQEAVHLKVIFTCGVIGATLSILLTNYFAERGTAYAVLIAQLLIAILTALIALKSTLTLKNS